MKLWIKKPKVVLAVIEALNSKYHLAEQHHMKTITSSPSFIKSLDNNYNIIYAAKVIAYI
jgi:hypothetical protein